jgi:hypothetical protein
VARRAGAGRNIWLDGKPWFVHADWCLWATKVGGSADLINRLGHDADREIASPGFQPEIDTPIEVEGQARAAFATL